LVDLVHQLAVAAAPFGSRRLLVLRAGRTREQDPAELTHRTPPVLARRDDTIEPGIGRYRPDLKEVMAQSPIRATAEDFWPVAIGALT